MQTIGFILSDNEKNHDVKSPGALFVMASGWFRMSLFISPQVLGKTVEYLKMKNNENSGKPKQKIKIEHTASL